jgi:hypothetical protein
MHPSTSLRMTCFIRSGLPDYGGKSVRRDKSNPLVDGHADRMYISYRKLFLKAPIPGRACTGVFPIGPQGKKIFSWIDS